MLEEKNTLAAVIGRRIRLARETVNLSQAQVALQLRISESRYRSYELGDVLIPLDVLVELPKVLKRELTYFLGVPNGQLSDEDRLLLDCFRRTLSPSLRQSTLVVARANFEHDEAMRQSAGQRIQATPGGDQ